MSRYLSGSTFCFYLFMRSELKELYGRKYGEREKMFEKVRTFVDIPNNLFIMKINQSF